jgi:DNA-binding response OmpR family regulator
LTPDEKQPTTLFEGPGEKHHGTRINATLGYLDCFTRRSTASPLGDEYSEGGYGAGDKREFDHALTNLKPAVLLLDLALDRLGGVCGLASIQRISPVTKIVVFSNAPRITEELSALKLGAKEIARKKLALAC